MNISPTQIVLARILAGVKQEDLARAIGRKPLAISRIERGESGGHKSTIDDIAAFFDARGIEFLPGDGVRRKPKTAQIILHGRQGMRAFFDDVYAETAKTGKDIYIFNGMPGQLIEWAGDEWYRGHAARMKNLLAERGFTSKTIVEKGETNLIGKSFALYKWFPKERFHSRMVYVYGNKIAHMDFDGEAVIRITEEEKLAETFRVLIGIAWEEVAEGGP